MSLIQKIYRENSNKNRDLVRNVHAQKKAETKKKPREERN